MPFLRETSEIRLERLLSAVLCENGTNDYPRTNCPKPLILTPLASLSTADGSYRKTQKFCANTETPCFR